MSDATASGGLDVTLRDFASGQKVFSRYTLIKILGRGGMGVVWLAHDEELDRDVALKFLPELIIHDRAVLSDLKRETKRSLELTHKNIVRIHDFVHDNQSGCISMEFIDGDTLSNLRSDKERKAFEVDELKQWLAQLCDALDYAHNHARIVHRDLKPSNLMVNQRGDLKVADFGIARSLSDSMSLLTMNQGTSGTLVYMSPQQLDGERGTHLDDVYSFGATIYELLTSKPPFFSGEIPRQIREKKPPLMSQRRKELEVSGAQIPLKWEKTIAACLEKDPSKRPQSVREIARQLNVAAAVSSETSRASTSKSHRRNVVLAATAAALLIAAFVSWRLGVHMPNADWLKHLRAMRRETAPHGGKIAVKTVPEGAKVNLGKAGEARSPATFDNVTEGKYPLRITLAGYQPVEKEIEIKREELTDLGVITLQPEVGSIELTSDPTGATVQQDNKTLGVTPLHIEKVPVGASKFTVSAPTYSPKTIEISVVPNQKTASSVALAKAAIAVPATTPGSSLFGGIWTGIIKLPAGFGTVEESLVINSTGTFVIEKSRLAHSGRAKPMHQATNDGKTMRWHAGVLNTAIVTFTPNPDGQTAVYTDKGPTGSYLVTFRKEPNSQSAAESASIIAQSTEMATAKPVIAKPGFVYNPYDPTAKDEVDVRGKTSGSKIKDPVSGRLFIIP